MVVGDDDFHAEAVGVHHLVVSRDAGIDGDDELDNDADDAVDFDSDDDFEEAVVSEEDFDDDYDDFE